jgi:hypothetical protein
MTMFAELLDQPPTLPDINANCREYVVIADAASFAKRTKPRSSFELKKKSRYGSYTLTNPWLGHYTAEKAMECARNGDASLVARSDEYLSALEIEAPTSQAWRTLDSVVGAFPNVPAYLAGNPHNMRLRRRTNVDTAPLTIVVDIGSSAGVSQDQLLKRGAALLALVRVLSNLRPVELYATTMLGSDTEAHITIVKIDTTPLDLARAAFMLSHPAYGRGLMYQYFRKVHHRPYQTDWPYGGNRNLSRLASRAHELFGAYLKTDKFLFLAGKHLTSIPDPVEWLKEMISKYGADNQGE